MKDTYIYNTEYIALAHAIMARPDDDLPRMRLRDWLEENDLHALAYTIQVDLERKIPWLPTSTNPNEVELAFQIQELSHPYPSQLVFTLHAAPLRNWRGTVISESTGELSQEQRFYNLIEGDMLRQVIYFNPQRHMKVVNEHFERMQHMHSFYEQIRNRLQLPGVTWEFPPRYTGFVKAVIA